MMDSSIVYAICVRCSHPVAEHQPCYGAVSGSFLTYGCSICDCQLTEVQKLRAFGGE